MVRFGTLEIVARTCERTPPEEPPESVAFLDISELRRGEAPKDLFHGWMFASSPGLNALEHRSEEHTSELQSLMRISYAVFCLKKKKHISHYYNDIYNAHIVY